MTKSAEEEARMADVVAETKPVAPAHDGENVAVPPPAPEDVAAMFDLSKKKKKKKKKEVRCFWLIKLFFRDDDTHDDSHHTTFLLEISRRRTMKKLVKALLPALPMLVPLARRRCWCRTRPRTRTKMR